VCAAENNFILLDAMPDDSAIAVRTNGSKLLDRAFEAIKGVGFVGNPHFKSLVIVVPALIASGHGSFLSPALRLINRLRGDWFRRDVVEAIKIAKCPQVGLCSISYLVLQPSDALSRREQIGQKHKHYANSKPAGANQ
jgi:hypothetical protein